LEDRELFKAISGSAEFGRNQNFSAAEADIAKIMS
jgi:hypothetical protein